MSTVPSMVVLRGLGQAPVSLGPMGVVLSVCLPLAAIGLVHAPATAGPFGRVPVTATVDGRTWATSVWRDSRSGWLLPVPARIHRGKDDGDVVTAEIAVDTARL